MKAPRSNYGISRIDQPAKKNHGYYVRITHRGSRHQKYFPDKSNGGKTKALKAAKEHRDALLARMPKYKQEIAARRKRRIKQSGTTGVTHVLAKSPKGKVYEYWQAAWLDNQGRRRTKKFSIARHGEEKALRLAKKTRREKAGGKKKTAKK